LGATRAVIDAWKPRKRPRPGISGSVSICSDNPSRVAIYHAGIADGNCLNT